MTLAQANIEIRERLREQLSVWRLREDYPPYIETASDHGPVPTEEDTNNQAQHWAERGA